MASPLDPTKVKKRAQLGKEELLIKEKYITQMDKDGTITSFQKKTPKPIKNWVDVVNVVKEPLFNAVGQGLRSYEISRIKRSRANKKK